MSEHKPQIKASSFAKGSYCKLSRISDTIVRRDYTGEMSVYAFIEHFILTRIPKYKYILHSHRAENFGFELKYFNSDLQKMLDRDILTSYDLKDKFRLAKQLVKSVEYLHRLNIIHGDISPANILVKRQEHSSDDYICLSDFNLSAKVQNPYYETQSHTCYCYTYRHPKMAFNSKIDAQTDWFATGMVLLEMFSGFCVYLHSFIKDSRYHLLSNLTESQKSKDVISKDILEGRIFASLFNHHNLRHKYYEQAFPKEHLEIYSELVEIFFTQKAENIYQTFMEHPAIKEIEIQEMPDYTEFINKSLYQFKVISRDLKTLLTRIEKDPQLVNINIKSNHQLIPLLEYLKNSKNASEVVNVYQDFVLKILPKLGGIVNRKLLYALCSGIDFWISPNKYDFYGSNFFTIRDDKWYRKLYHILNGDLYGQINE